MESQEETPLQREENIGGGGEDSSTDSGNKKLKSNKLEPTKRPRNLRVRLENVDYKDFSCKSDFFSISLAMARIFNSKCHSLNLNPAYDTQGKLDEKLTVLRSLIEHHMLQCQHCRAQLSDLDYFDVQQQDSVDIIQELELKKRNELQEEKISELKNLVRNNHRRITAQEGEIVELKNAAADNQKKIELQKDQISTLKSTKINTQLLNVPADKVSQAQILPRTRTYADLKKLPDLDLGLESNEIRPQSVSDTVEIEDNEDENNFEDKKDETFPSSSPIASGEENVKTKSSLKLRSFSELKRTD